MSTSEFTAEDSVSNASTTATTAETSCSTSTEVVGSYDGKDNIGFEPSEKNVGIQRKSQAHVTDCDTMSGKRIIKNLVAASVAFLMLFTSIAGLDALQSSLLKDEGLGMICQATKFAAMILCCLVLPTLAIQTLGQKRCIAVCFFGYLAWMLANGYAVWATMVPASILIGAAGACNWPAVNSYLSMSAHQYAEITGQETGATVTRFFGIFFCIMQISGVTGSVISSTILSLRPENVTVPSEEDLEKFCGLADCPGNNFTNTNLDKSSPKVIWTMVAIYFGLAAIAFIIWCIFVDPLPSSWHSSPGSESKNDDGRRTSSCFRGKCERPACKSVLWSMTSTLRDHTHVALLLLIPITISDSLAFVFRVAEYTKSFVSCYMGIWMIGWVSVPASVAGIVASLIGGQTTKFVGILPMFLIGSSFAFAAHLTLMFWTPSASHGIPFYVIACAEKIGACVIKIELSAFYGLLFPDKSEAAFANYKLWDSVGCLLAFAYSSVLCTDVKLYVNIGSRLVGTALVIVVYFAFYRRRNAHSFDDIVI